MMGKHFTLLILVLNCFFLYAQQENYEISLSKSIDEIVLDGELTESAWKKCDIANGFCRNFPVDSGLAFSKTEVRITYDEQFLYIGAVCYDEMRGDYIISSLKRDFGTDNNDYFMVILDPFKDGNTGFTFAVNPYGVQREGMIQGGPGQSIDWDNKWYSKVKRDDDKWVAEIAIPFKSIRYKKGENQWRINFARQDLKRNERSSWTPIPIQFDISSVAFAGTLNWDKPTNKTGSNISFIPYITGGASRNKLTDPIENRLSGNAGFDTKIAVTSSLNLDVTVNPDFSQVEVDRQVTDLNRFEIFFPERRQFFLENNDLFANYGFRRIRPFFSRRIGVAIDTNTGQNIQNPIIYGTRLSGKVNNKIRIGLLNMQTARDTSSGIEGINYSMASMQAQTFGRSYFSAFVVNKEDFFNKKGELELASTDFNRVAGIEHMYLSTDNRMMAKVFYHKSFSDQNQKGRNAHASFIRYTTRKVELEWNHERVAEHYNAEVGFVPRRGYWRLEPKVAFNFYPRSEKIQRHQVELYSEITSNNAFKITDRIHKISYQANFINTGNFKFQAEQYYVLLTFPFDPTNTGGKKLAAGSSYNYWRTGVEYASDRRKLFVYNLSASTGSYFNGVRNYLRTGVDYRHQPYGNLGIEFEYNNLQFPEPYNDAALYLIGPKVDISFTKNLFLSTTVQYNNQINNINVNSRFQWRFRPVSDLYIVYTDNYFSNNLLNKNRFLVFKLTYWV